MSHLLLLRISRLGHTEYAQVPYGMISQIIKTSELVFLDFSFFSVGTEYSKEENLPNAILKRFQSSNMEYRKKRQLIRVVFSVLLGV